ncbi:MAG: CAP domain-containing protein [Hyphomicrobiaceae bacterium]
MSRVILPAILIVAVTGCSMSSKPLTSGFGDSGSTTATSVAAAEARKAPKPQQGLGGDPDSRAALPKAPNPTPNQRLARLDDRAPPGTYDKAPAGALADRDYSLTQLNAERALELINAYRKEKGLKPLKLNAELSNAAKNHSRDLAKWDRISHFGSDGSNPWDRVKRSGYNARLAAENVGTGQVNFDEVMKGWKESPGHNKNLLLADAEHMGIALVQESKTEFKTFWTLVIGSPL